MSPLSTQELQRQIDATRNRPLHTLPASWWDEDVAVAMRDWITRFIPDGHRRRFTYGAQS